LYARNKNTLWGKSQRVLADGSILVEAADPLDVIENSMQYFYSMGLQGVKACAKHDEVAKYFSKAAHLASLVAPYRHPRLSAVKHVDVSVSSLDGIPKDATAEELRAQLAKRIATLRDKGYIDLEALPPPSEPRLMVKRAKSLMRLNARCVLCFWGRLGEAA
jgi:hypothetical protein